MAMTMKRRFALSSGAIVILALAQLALTLLLMDNQKDLTHAQHVQHLSWQLSQELRSSSDELTRTARTYVVTGDRAYEREYWNILAVRDGQAPRTDGRRVPLRRLMEEIGFTKEELAKLNEAEDNSNALVATEVAAFQAMRGRFTEEPNSTSRDLDDYTRTGEPDREFAIRIMHDEKYHQDKARIMGPITESEEMVKARTLAAVDRYTQRSHNLILTSAIVGFLLVLIAVGAHFLAQRPVLASIQLVRSELQELASGSANLSKRLSVTGKDEIGALVTAFNQLMGRLDGLIHQIRLSGEHVNAATARMSNGAESLEKTVGRQVSAAENVLASAREISGTSAELTRTMGGIAQQSRESAEVAGRSRQDLETMATGMAEIENAAKLISAKLSMISDKAKNIANVVTTITRVSEQTNLLSLNAAIEAERAGQHGQGFSVVAREIRRLADQTALATIDIEKTVVEMQAAVDGGVSTMDLFSQRVRSSTAAVHEAAKNTSGIAKQVEALSPEFASVLRGMEAQSDGARQISQTMADLSDTTRQTAEMIEESQSAIGELNRAAESLRSGVGMLQVTD